MAYTVYKLTSPSNKVYIGITSRSVKQRWNNGIGYKKCPAMNNAIRKYGWENIKKEILLENTTEEEAKSLETLLIKLHRSNESGYGYNLTEGGDGTKGYYPSEETRKKRSEALKGRKYPNRKRVLSEKERKRLSDSFKGTNNPLARKVICLETLRVYDTMTQAQKETGATKITVCCKHYYKHKSSAGLHWEYYDESISDDEYKNILQELIEEEYENKHHSPSEENRRKTSERSSVPVICVETGVVFKSLEAVCQTYNISKANLCNCCIGKRKTAGGFHWRYAT